MSHGQGRDGRLWQREGRVWRRDSSRPPGHPKLSVTCKGQGVGGVEAGLGGGSLRSTELLFCLTGNVAPSASSEKSECTSLT